MSTQEILSNKINTTVHPATDPIKIFSEKSNSEWSGIAPKKLTLSLGLSSNKSALAYTISDDEFLRKSPTIDFLYNHMKSKCCFLNICSEHLIRKPLKNSCILHDRFSLQKNNPIHQ